MAKAGKRAQPKPATVPARTGGAAAGRRARAATDAAKPPAAKPPGRRSAAMQLAAEVERLERELAAARREIDALAERADVDPLTDVLNRRGFERELKRSLAYLKRYGTSAALLYVDLDRFKSINDRHGHAAGDAVLKAVTMVIARQVRASDVVARLGGDEFGVLLWNLSEADALTKAQAIEAAIARTTATHAGAALSVGASVGTAMLQPLDRPAEALERADAAMYARKAVREGTRAAS
jgi:diguanylate cyclase (GGDEF)-like protein